MIIPHLLLFSYLFYNEHMFMVKKKLQDIETTNMQIFLWIGKEL